MCSRSKPFWIDVVKQLKRKSHKKTHYYTLILEFTPYLKVLAICVFFFIMVNFAFVVWKIIVARLRKQDATERPRDTITS